MSLPPRDEVNPDGWVMVLSEAPMPSQFIMGQLANTATQFARQMAPKVSGVGADGLQAVWGDSWVGIHSRESYMVHQNRGIRPRVMKDLAGKTIPMWITDDDGSMTEGVPASKRAERTRVTRDGRRQVLIFRKAAPIGSTKQIMRQGRLVTVPRHYPGAPGRVDAKTGRFGGVWWRHPGLPNRQFIEDALILAATRSRINIREVYPARVGGE